MSLASQNKKKKKEICTSLSSQTCAARLLIHRPRITLFLDQQTPPLDPLPGNSKRRHITPDLTWIRPILDHLEPSGTIEQQRLHPHLCLASIAPELVLHHRALLVPDQRVRLINLKLEPGLKVCRQALLIHKILVPRDDQHARLAILHAALGILDSVQRNLDVVSSDDHWIHERGMRDEPLRGLGREEDDLGGRGAVRIPVGVVDVGCVDAAYVPYGCQELLFLDIRREVGQPQGAVLLWLEIFHAGVVLGVHAVVSGRELERGYLGACEGDWCEVLACLVGTRDGQHGDESWFGIWMGIWGCRGRVGWRRVRRHHVAVVLLKGVAKQIAVQA